MHLRVPAQIRRPGPRVLWAAMVIVSASPTLVGCDDEDPGGALGPAAQTDLYVCNLSTGAVDDVRVRSAGTLEWGENRLSGSISAGNCFGFVARVASGRYDLRIGGERGEVVIGDFPVNGISVAATYSPEPPASTTTATAWPSDSSALETDHGQTAPHRPSSRESSRGVAGSGESHLPPVARDAEF